MARTAIRGQVLSDAPLSARTAWRTENPSSARILKGTTLSLLNLSFWQPKSPVVSLHSGFQTPESQTPRAQAANTAPEGAVARSTSPGRWTRRRPALKAASPDRPRAGQRSRAQQTPAQSSGPESLILFQIPVARNLKPRLGGEPGRRDEKVKNKRAPTSWGEGGSPTRW